MFKLVKTLKQVLYVQERKENMISVSEKMGKSQYISGNYEKEANRNCRKVQHPK